MLTQRHTEKSEVSIPLAQLRLSPYHPDSQGRSIALRKNDQESQLFIAIRGLQVDLRQRQLADPIFSQSRIFRFCAPLAVFLYFFIIGMTVPRNSTVVAYMAVLMRALGGLGILVALCVLSVGAVLVLVTVWALIWPLARVLRSFCEWDVTELNTMTADSSAEYEFSQANMLFGGLLT